MDDGRAVVARGRVEEMRELQQVLRRAGHAAELVRPPGARTNA